MTDKTITLKLGNQTISHQFSAEQFLTDYAAQNKGVRNPYVIMEGVFGDKMEYSFYQQPIMEQPFFAEGAPMNKNKDGFFKPKPVSDPSRQFLLLGDEELKELPFEDEHKFQKKVGKLWPFNYSAEKDILFDAGKAYFTGRRIIFDSQFSTADFGSLHFWGPIDFREFAQSIGLPSLAVPVHEDDEWNRPRPKPIDAILLETRGTGGIAQDSARRIIGTFYELDYILKKASGEETQLGKTKFDSSIVPIEKELLKAKPTSLTDILAMWQYASNAGLMKTNSCSFDIRHMFKEKVTLKRIASLHISKPYRN